MNFTVNFYSVIKWMEEIRLSPLTVTDVPKENSPDTGDVFIFLGKGRCNLEILLIPIMASSQADI